MKRVWQVVARGVPTATDTYRRTYFSERAASWRREILIYDRSVPRDAVTVRRGYIVWDDEEAPR